MAKAPRDIKIWLVGPSGDKELWLIRFAPFPKNRHGWWGDTNFIKRIITINSRLRSWKSIDATLLHEIVHVTCGNNGSEELAINLENNFVNARNTIAKLIR